MAESQQPPPLAGDISEEPDLFLGGIDIDQNVLESYFNQSQLPQEPTEDSRGLHGASDGPEFLSPVSGTGVSIFDTRHGAFGPSLPLPPEYEHAQKKQSLAAPTMGRDLFLHQTFVLRAAFRKTSNPSDSEIRQLCSETRLEEYQVSIWFQGERDLWRDTVRIGLMMPGTTHPVVLSSCLYPDPMDSSQNAENWLAQELQTNAIRQERRLLSPNPCPYKRSGSPQSPTSNLVLQKRPRRRCGEDSEQEQYPCPSCASKYKTIDQWHTHQKRTHFPTEVFICGKDVGKKPCEVPPTHPFKRKDNFKNHLKDSHCYEPGSALDEEVSKCTVKVTGLFHEECGFCPKTLGSYGESMEHISAHIRSGAELKDWVHRCSSPDHEILPNVHFVSLNDTSERDKHATSTTATTKSQASPSATSPAPGILTTSAGGGPGYSTRFRGSLRDIESNTSRHLQGSQRYKKDADLMYFQSGRMKSHMRAENISGSFNTSKSCSRWQGSRSSAYEFRGYWSGRSNGSIVLDDRRFGTKYEYHERLDYWTDDSD